MWFPPRYLLSPGYPALAALQALPAHPTLCLAGAAPGWEAQQLHKPSLPSRGNLFQLLAASPSLLCSSPLFWFGGSQCSGAEVRQITQMFISGEPLCYRHSHGFFPGKLLGFRIRSGQALGHPQWDVREKQEAMNNAELPWMQPSRPVCASSFPCCCQSTRCLPAFPERNTSCLSSLHSM